MITKKRHSKVSSGTLYGVAGGVFGIITVGLMIQSQLAPDTYPSCSERYANAGMFALERPTGDVLNPAEIQSRLAGREWGILQNIAIKPDQTPVGKVAMTVKFNAGGSLNQTARTASGGIGFNWQPSYLQSASSACLSYSVRLPADFKFANGGTLPGLFGKFQETKAGDGAQFSTRMRWLEGGRLGIQPVTPQQRLGQLIPLAPNWLRMPLDQWVSFEQEVILNKPGQADGILRVWIDGKLEINMSGIAFRTDSGGFAGATADTHYSDRAMGWSPAPSETEIKISPMIVRWN